MDRSAPVLEKLSRQLEETKTIETSPFIKSSLKIIGPVFVQLSIMNIGKGPALNVNLEFSLEPGDFRKSWVNPLLLPGERSCFFLPESNLAELAKKFNFVALKGHCADIFGNSIKIEDKIDLKRVQKGWHESGMVYDEPLDEKIDRLITELDRMENALRRIVAFGGGVLIKTPEDLRKEYESAMKRRKEASKEKKSVEESQKQK